VRAVHWILYLLAVMAFVVPAVYLIQVWPQKAPPGPREVDRARVEASDDAYRITLPSGARYQLARSDVNGSSKRRAALALVRSQLSSDYSSHMHVWARFWFLLAGACGVAMLLTLASRSIEDAESRVSRNGSTVVGA
jgi:hypothetical protein